MNWERWARAAGIGFFLFTVAAFIVGGEPPKISDSPEEVVAYFTDNRSRVLFHRSCSLSGSSSFCGSPGPSQTRCAKVAKAALRPQHSQRERRGCHPARTNCNHRGPSGGIPRASRRDEHPPVRRPREPEACRRVDGRLGHGRRHGRDADRGGRRGDGVRRSRARDDGDPRRSLTTLYTSREWYRPAQRRRYRRGGGASIGFRVSP